MLSEHSAARAIAWAVSDHIITTGNIHYGGDEFIAKCKDYSDDRRYSPFFTAGRGNNVCSESWITYGRYELCVDCDIQGNITVKRIPPHGSSAFYGSEWPIVFKF